MIRWVAAMTVVTASAGLGLLSAGRLRLHVRALRSLCAALETASAEIGERLLPMPELVELLATRAPEPGRRIFERLLELLPELGILSFAELWQRAIDTALEPELPTDARETLAALGLSLGRYGAEEQQRAIGQALARLEHCCLEAERRSTESGRLYAGLGLTLGLLIVIVLL